MSRTTVVTSPTPSTTLEGPVRVLAHRGLGPAARAHHGALRARTGTSLRRLCSGERGQGTVEYVALAMLIAAVMAGVVLAAGGLQGGGIAQAVVEKVKSAINTAGAAPKVK
ncbi:unannotated protein [freshwater metagenome]|uniref:Unannotated protein n=1 Tax=freshwater metagenome TaxID=449393 RepID=A0A6J7J934_9ZZZZ|nr:hypothetical protein [Actinomycetota bacterium]